MGLLESNIVAKIARVGLSRQAIAGALEISESLLSRGLSGIRPLCGSDLIRIDTALNALLDISTIVAPFALPSDVATLKILLRRYRDNRLDELRNDALTELRTQVAELQRL